MPLSHRVLLVHGWIAIAACAFDDNGLQTGSNSLGTLESSGSEATESAEGPTTNPPTSTSAGTSMTTTSPSTTATTDDTSTLSTTTAEPTTGTGDETTTDEPGTTTSDSSAENGTSSSEGGVESSSSESGEPSNPYGPCDASEDCNGGTCIDLYTNFELNHHVCYPEPDCMSDDDCPAGDGGVGDAVPYCSLAGCTLDCTGDLACPTGMTCAYTQDANRRCGWPD